MFQFRQPVALLLASRICSVPNHERMFAQGCDNNRLPIQRSPALPSPPSKLNSG